MDFLHSAGSGLAAFQDIMDTANDITSAAGNVAGSVGRGLGNLRNLLKRGRSPAQARRTLENFARGVARQYGAGGDGFSTPSTGNTVVPAQFIPGKGGELAYNRQNLEKPIRFKSGESAGRPPVDAYARERMMYTPQVVQHALAFKMVLVPPSFFQSSESLPVSRFFVHHVYRHNVYQSVNTTVPTSTYGAQNNSWNETLGPDKSYIRRLPSDGVAPGTAYAIPPSTQSINYWLLSPYRFPQSGGWCFPRLNRQMMENLGWNANPIKTYAIAQNASATSVPLIDNMRVYANAPRDTTGAAQRSIPNQVPIDSSSEGTTSVGPSFYYKNQTGVGEVSYCFNNDGTNPIVIDIVITRMKKNEQMTDLTEMLAQYKQGYLNYSFANKNQANFSGETPQDIDVTTNARGPFLPSKALDSLSANATRTDLKFRQVGRDQFIVAGGGTRAWTMNLESMNYDARRYNQPVALVDDLSYVVSIAVSGVPVPFIESSRPGATDSISAVIDKRGQGCNCSVTGHYKEVIHPVYLSKAIGRTYVNGNLDVPMYANTDPPTAPVLGSADIVNIGQATRSNLASSAYISLGPTNTTPGL